MAAACSPDAMTIKEKVVIVTGGAEGIGRALCRRFAVEGARTIVVADVNAAGASAVAGEIGGWAIATDVARQEEVARLVEAVTERCGGIDLFCSNAGIMIEGGVDTPDEDWEAIWSVNVLAHLYAARAVLP